MKEVFKIVRGNQYPIKVFVEKMGYEDGKLKAQAVDVRTIEDLKVYAVGGGRYHQLDAKVASGGEYVTVTVPASCCMRLGRYGIRLTGSLEGLRIAPAERRVFVLVRWNGKDYVPPKIVDGESSYYINLKFAPGDSDISPIGPVQGRIGFAVFDDVSQIDVESLPSVSNVYGNHTITNSTDGARMIIVGPVGTSLSFTFGDIPVEMDYYEDNNYGYYYTDPQYSDSFEVSIS